MSKRILFSVMEFMSGQDRFFSSSPKGRMYHRLLFLGPLSPMPVLMVFPLPVFFISHTNLLWSCWRRISVIDDCWWVFPIGLRMNMGCTGILLFVPTLVLLILPGRVIRSLRYYFTALFNFLAAIIIHARRYHLSDTRTMMKQLPVFNSGMSGISN